MVEDDRSSVVIKIYCLLSYKRDVIQVSRHRMFNNMLWSMSQESKNGCYCKQVKSGIDSREYKSDLVADKLFFPLSGSDGILRVVSRQRIASALALRIWMG